MKIDYKKKPFLKFLFLLFFQIFIFLFFWTDPSIKNYGTIKIYDRNDILLYEQSGGIGSKRPLSYEEFPKELIAAVLVAEDENFWTNNGIDFLAILRSIYLNLKNHKIVSGASTITQQLARMNVLNPEDNKRSYLRKIREVLIALRLNLTLNKKQILTLYLNNSYFGNLTYGVESASNLYFEKTAKNLSLGQSAFLAGLISSPSGRDPYVHFQVAKKRQEKILEEMFNKKIISNEQYKSAVSEPLIISRDKKLIKAPHFVHYVLDEFEKLKIKTDRGIVIKTTLDYPVFQLSEELARLWVDKNFVDHDLSNMSLVLLDNNSGEILNMLGGIDYFDSTRSGQVNMVTSKRQPGSALKPVTYVTAFSQGFTPATFIYDIPKVFQTKKKEGYLPNNYDGMFHGLILVREALASSLNLPAVEMLSRVGLNAFFKTAEKMGISTFIQKDRYDLSITLGGGEVTLLELTNVYATFARKLIYKKTYAISEIYNDDKKILWKHQKENGEKVFLNNNEQLSFLITDILSDAKSRILGFGEKNPLVLSRPAAVKTGTTTDWHDNWTIGYTPSYTVGVWAGNNDNHPMKNISGVTGAAPLWNQFFEEYLKDKTVEKFEIPNNIVEKKICKLSGDLDDGVCPEKYFEKFILGFEPKKVSSLHKKIKIDVRNGLLVSDFCEKEFIKEEVLVDYPPELYSWAVKNNLRVIPAEVSPFCLNQAQKSDSRAFVSIINPKNKAVFENAPNLILNQGIVFEVNVSSNINKVNWYVDGIKVGESTNFPYNFSWKLKVGDHSVYAEGKTDEDVLIKSSFVNFRVVEYKENSK